MLKLSGKLRNIDILSLRTGGPVAIAVNAIINPHNLKIIGWWCRVPGSTELQVLLANDIRDISDKTMAINDEQDIIPAEDLVRHKEVLEIKYDLIGKIVKTKRSRIGKVADFSYNDGLFVQKLYVEKPIHKVFSIEDTVLIDRTQILEVSDHYILVRDTDIKLKSSELAGAAAEPA